MHGEAKGLSNKLVIRSKVETAARAQMYVYPQAYNPVQPNTPARTQPLLAFVSLYAGDELAFENRPITVLPNGATRLGVTAFNFSIGLRNLPPGSYQCQISVVDPAASKTTFWRAPIVITPNPPA